MHTHTSCTDAGVAQLPVLGARAWRPARCALSPASGQDKLALLADRTLQPGTAARAAGRTSAQGCAPTTSAWLDALPPRASAAHTPPLPPPAAAAPLPPGAPGAAAAPACEHCAGGQPTQLSAVPGAHFMQGRPAQAGAQRQGARGSARYRRAFKATGLILCALCAAP